MAGAAAADRRRRVCFIEGRLGLHGSPVAANARGQIVGDPARNLWRGHAGAADRHPAAAPGARRQPALEHPVSSPGARTSGQRGGCGRGRRAPAAEYSATSISLRLKPPTTIGDLPVAIALMVHWRWIRLSLSTCAMRPL